MSFFSLIIIVVIILLIRSSLAKQKKNGGGASAGGKESPLNQLFNAIRYEKWMETAGKLRGQYNRPDADTNPSISGRRDKFTFQIFPASRESSKITYRVIFPVSIENGLQIMHDSPAMLENIFCRSPKFKKQYFSTPDLACSAKNETWFSQYLAVEGRKQQILEMRELYQSFLLSDTGITVILNGDTNPESSVMEELLAGAKILYPDKSQAKQPVNRPGQIQPLPAPPRQTPAEPPAQSRQTPPPIQTPVASTEPVPKKPVNAEKAAPVSCDLDMETLCRKFFTAAFPGKPEENAFSAVKGKTVIWTGTLQSVYEYSYDFVFGNKKGAKAMLTLFEIEGSFGSKQMVKAVVSFSVEYMAVLRAKQNSTVRFRGTLLKFDSFAKELFLSEGDLE